jgi:uncharacterized protein (TIGR04551 family)
LTVKAWLVALSFSCATALAQPSAAPDAGTPTRPAGASTEAELRREMEAKLEAAKKEIREEIRAQMAGQAAAQSWQEEVTEEKRKLELFVPNGYFRVRPELYNKFDLNRGPDAGGYYLYPHSTVSFGERTTAGINMRFRFEPTLNVSEEVRIKMQVDAFDNLVWGSTPAYGLAMGDRDTFTVFSSTQAPPTSGINSVRDSIAVKRVYGEVATPVWGGILRFGRMGSHWGLGMLHNDGNCLDCDHGDTVDRIMFVAEPFSGWYITPMVDYNAVGPTTVRLTGDNADPLPLSNQDASISFILAIARRDVEQQAKNKLQNNQSVFNYGLHLEFRSQKYDAATYYFQPPTDSGPSGPDQPATTPDPGRFGPPSPPGSYVPRSASLWMPDIWVKFERKNVRIELETAAILGSINGSALTSSDVSDLSKYRNLSVTQFGAVLQGEYRLVDGALHLGLETGYASGDRRYGVGNHQGRPGSFREANGALAGSTAPGDIDGPRFCIVLSDRCGDSDIKNFRFNRDYHVDMILWRQLLGGVTNAIYVKPSIKYDVTEGFNLFASIIYSRAVFPEGTPSATNTGLGVEINAGVRYETDDGFFAQFMYGVLFPLAGLQQFSPPNSLNPPPGLDTAQALRAMLGIRF